MVVVAYPEEHVGALSDSVIARMGSHRNSIASDEQRSRLRPFEMCTNTLPLFVPARANHLLETFNN